MDFSRELAALLAQVPRGSATRCGDLARALGDARAAAAVFRFLRDYPELPGAHRVLTEAGRPTSRAAPRVLQSEGWGGKGFTTSFHSDKPLSKLRAEQERIAAKVSRRNGFRTVRTIGGVDVAYEDGRGFASLVVVRARDLAVVEEVLIVRDADFPYIPTYLAYRELPFIRAAFERLSEPPTVLLVDGHGQLHPRRCGIACMAGVSLDVPTIGVAKNPLVGTMDRRPKIGESVPVRHEGDVLGYAMRTGSSLKPMFVSVGHRVAPATAVKIVRGLCRTRHPEPLRLAHIHATRMKEEQRKKRVRRFSTRSHPQDGEGLEGKRNA